MSGTGSIFKLPNGRYRAQLSIGGRDSRRFATRTVTTRAEAKAALRDLAAENAEGLRPATQSLGAYLRRWLDDSAKASISANTYRGYDDVLTNHLTPIAGVPLADLTAEDIERVLAGMTTHRYRAKSQRPASPKTIRNAQLMLRRALGQAEERGHVRRNVARFVPLRKVPRHKRDAMTPALAKDVLAAIEGDPYEAAYALAMLGLRASEILGLTRSAVRLDPPASVYVHQQVLGSGPRARMAELKTAASEDAVPLPPFVVSRLRAHLAKPRDVLTAGDYLVFVNGAGYAVNGSWFSKRLRKLTRDAGLPELTPHALRHGAATLLIAAGAHPRVAQQLLRHASSRTTMEIYGHVTSAQQREAVDLLERAVG